MGHQSIWEGRVAAIGAAYSSLFIFILITLNANPFGISYWWSALIFIIIPASVVYIDWEFVKQFYVDHTEYSRVDFFFDVIIIITMSQLFLAYSRSSYLTWWWFAVLFSLYFLWDVWKYKSLRKSRYSPLFQLIGDIGALAAFLILSYSNYIGCIEYNCLSFLLSMIAYYVAVILWHIPNRSNDGMDALNS